ncbi:MAG: SHOCT domain-containing protein [Varibaculum sp.]|nr:SHOCT domain-containing protein [Varibaculum sp.]
MTEAQFKREAHYRATLNTAHCLTNTGLLTAGDFARIQEALQAKYSPPIGRLDGPNRLDKRGEQSDV